MAKGSKKWLVKSMLKRSKEMLKASKKIAHGSKWLQRNKTKCCSEKWRRNEVKKMVNESEKNVEEK